VTVHPLLLRTAFCGLLSLSLSPVLFAQACQTMPYLHQNKFDPHPLELARVRGRAVDENGMAVAQLCIGIFSEPDHKLLRYAQSGENGKFNVDTNGLADGEYRLVGYIPGFCPANAILNISSNSHSQHKRALVIRMNLPGTADCSDVQLSKK